ncbi:MAG TPA: hypothetical protein VFQ53_07800 [Kofleriaceae bacterium]|nr:hypothetical protein [Kofleriaceae bacterium]
MPAREADRLEPETDQAPEVAPAEPEAAKTEFTSEGDLPAIAQTNGAATGATASELAFGGPQTANLSHLDAGIHDWEQYKADCEAGGKPEKWKDHYRAGHTEAKGWSQPYEHRSMFDWQLEKGHSASEAVQAWIKGPTIAEYRSAAVADELDELRDEIGDHKFDEMFGSANEEQDAKIPKGQRLRISASLYSIPLIDQMKALIREHDARERPAEEEAPAPMVEARVEERPKSAVAEEQEPQIVAQELGMQQQDRELV